MKGHIVRDLAFSPTTFELVVITADSELRFYTTRERGGKLLRKVSQVHRRAVTSLDFSKNGEFLVTGGADHTVKLWDADVNTTAEPYWFQSQIGHTYSVSKVFFNPNDNTQVISVGGKDGIFIWNFHGDTTDRPVKAESMIVAPKRGVKFEEAKKEEPEQ